jgi:hypothetical protein
MSVDLMHLEWLEAEVLKPTLCAEVTDIHEVEHGDVHRRPRFHELPRHCEELADDATTRTSGEHPRHAITVVGYVVGNTERSLWLSIPAGDVSLTADLMALLEDRQGIKPLSG